MTPTKPPHCIGFMHAGHSHIIAWDDAHRFDAGLALGRMMRTPEFQIDGELIVAIVEEMAEVAAENAQ